MTFNCYERSAVCSRRIHLTWVEWLNMDSPFSLQIASGGASTTFLLKTSNRSYWDKNPNTRASLIPSPSTHWSILSPVSTTVFLTHEAITSCPCISTHKNTSPLVCFWLLNIISFTSQCHFQKESSPDHWYHSSPSISIQPHTHFLHNIDNVRTLI